MIMGHGIPAGEGPRDQGWPPEEGASCRPSEGEPGTPGAASRAPRQAPCAVRGAAGGAGDGLAGAASAKPAVVPGPLGA